MCRSCSAYCFVLYTIGHDIGYACTVHWHACLYLMKASFLGVLTQSYSTCASGQNSSCELSGQWAISCSGSRVSMVTSVWPFTASLLSLLSYVLFVIHLSWVCPEKLTMGVHVSMLSFPDEFVSLCLTDKQRCVSRKQYSTYPWITDTVQLLFV